MATEARLEQLPARLKEGVYAEAKLQEEHLRMLLAKLEHFDTLAADLNHAWNQINQLTCDLSLLSETTTGLLPRPLVEALEDMPEQRGNLLLVQRKVEALYTTYKACKKEL